jgi:hypothetical protein
MEPNGKQYHERCGAFPTTLGAGGGDRISTGRLGDGNNGSKCTVEHKKKNVFERLSESRWELSTKIPNRK